MVFGNFMLLAKFQFDHVLDRDKCQDVTMACCSSVDGGLMVIGILETITSIGLKLSVFIIFTFIA